MNISLLSIFGILIFLTCLVLAIVSFIFGKLKIHKIWASFNISVSIWGLGMFFIGNKNLDANASMVWWKLSHIGAYFLPVTFLHTMMEFSSRRKSRILFFFYLQAAIFTILNFLCPGYKPEYMFSSFYYMRIINYPPYLISIILWFTAIVYGFIVLIKTLLSSTGAKRNQSKYLFFSMLIGFIGGVSHFFPAFGAIIYPFPITIVFYTLIVTYAILKHHLMDIRIAVTRVGIFTFVYAIVLGIPFWVGLVTKEWLLSTSSAVILASLGPLIYSRLRLQAEELLLKDQKRYQKALLGLSENMHQVKELSKLLRLILIQVTRHLRLRESAIYLLDKNDSAFRLKDSFPKGKSFFREQIYIDAAIINKLKNKDTPFLSEELSRKEQDELTKQPFSSGMLVPCTTRDALVAFMALGSKPKGLVYNELDISIFRILSLQAGLAIENCLFWEDEKTRIAREEQIRRQKSLDHFSASLVHEIGNPGIVVHCQIEKTKSLAEKLRVAFMPGKLKVPSQSFRNGIYQSIINNKIQVAY